MDDNDRWQHGTLPPDPEADAAPYGGKVLAFRGGAAHDPDRLPESADAEARLCGLVVAQEGAGYADLAAVARVDDFSDPAWRLVWGIVGEQVERAAPVDFPSVAERVQEAPVTDGGPPWSTRLAAGGSSGLDALAWAMGEASAGTAVAYATVVRETASRRAVILGCRRLAAQAGLKSTRLEDLARACDALGEGLRQSTTVERSMYAVGDEADLVLEAARKRAEGDDGGGDERGYRGREAVRRRVELWAVLSGPMVAGGVAGLVGCGCVTVDDEAWTFNRRSMGWWFAFGEWGLA